MKGKEGKCGLEVQSSGVEVGNKITPLFLPLVLLGKEKRNENNSKRKISAQNSPPK